jgi:hypothetical protein
MLLSCLLAPGSTLAQTAPKVAGELVSAHEASLNGIAAISGLTVFSGSKLKTADAGSATITVGKQGRFELGSGTDMVLNFAPNSVGGELLHGRAVLSVPAGVSIAVSTPEGRVVTDGGKPAVVAVDMTKERARVVSYLGEAKVVSAGRTESVNFGEEVVLQRESSTRGWKHGRLMALGAAGAAGAAGVVGAAGTAATAGQIGGTVATAAGATAATVATVAVPTTPTLFTLVNSSVDLSLPSGTQARGSGLTRDPRDRFRPALTCRDRNSSFCRRRSFAGQ